MKSGPAQFKDWMDRRGFNQEATAAHFGWHFTYISALTNGRRRPNLDNAIRIERETGIPVEAWQSSELDESATAVPDTAGKQHLHKA